MWSRVRGTPRETVSHSASAPVREGVRFALVKPVAGLLFTAVATEFIGSHDLTGDAGTGVSGRAGGRVG